MLVLTRKQGQRIFIGDDVVVEVKEVHRGEVRLGITAPESLSVLREELISSRAHKAAESGEER